MFVNVEKAGIHMGTYGFHAQHRNMVLMCLLTKAIMLYLYLCIIYIIMYVSIYVSQCVCGGGGGPSGAC